MRSRYESRQGESGRAKLRECVSGARSDNGDKQVKEVVLFRPRANEISQKQWSGKLYCVCHATRILASGDQESITPCQ